MVKTTNEVTIGISETLRDRLRVLKAQHKAKTYNALLEQLLPQQLQ